MVTQHLGDIGPDILVAAKAWKDHNEYNNIAMKLVKKFQKNFEQYDLGDAEILSAGPKIDN